MKYIRIILLLLVIAAAAFALVELAGFPIWGDRIFLDGEEVSAEGNILSLGRDVGEIRAQGDLNILLSGPVAVEKITVRGDLHVYGEGELTVKKLLRAGTLAVSEGAGVRGGRIKLRHGPYVSPLYTVEEDGILPPYTAAAELGYSELVVTQKVRRGESPQPPAAPRREKYRFDGWFEDAELTVPFDFTRPRYEDTVLYAAWMETVTLSFDTWGGSGIPDIIIDRGASAEAPGEDPVRLEHSFSGWYANKALTEPYDFSRSVDEDTTVYAKWTKNAVKVARGVDISRYQEHIDWPAMTGDGIEFAVIRAGYRGYGSEGKIYEDESFREHMDAAREQGLDTGVYFFSQAVSVAEAEEEADFVLGLIKDYELTLPVFMDYELVYGDSGSYIGRLADAGLSDEEYASVCAAFCSRIEQAGYTAMVYAGIDMLRAIGDTLEQQGYGAWLANWIGQTRYEGSFDYWQYSGSGTVRGVQSTVDLDYRYINPPERVSGVQLSQGVLTWDKQKGAYGYIIYRCTPDEEGFSEYARTKGASSTFLSDKKAPKGSKYMICAYVLHADREYRGGFSSAAE